MSVIAFGLNHQTAPLDLRGRMAFAPEQLAPALRGLNQRLERAAPEAAIVSTCNRTELYLAVGAATPPPVLEPALDWLAEQGRISAEQLQQHGYLMRDRDAARHAFRVASGLDSMVLGEPQILGQMKAQFRLAVEGAAAARILRRCFERSFTVAKRVRNETGVAGKAVSLSSAAVELAKRIFDDLGDKTAMLIGAGKMSELAARHFVGQGIASVIVTNRSFDRAVDLARQFGGTPVPFDRYAQYLPLADVVLGSVTTSGYLFGPSQLHEVLRARRRRPMFFIDLGVPRNFDPAINDLDNVYLYNIDDLANVADDHRAEREKEAVEAEEIVREETERFWQWISRRDVTPTIVALRGKLDGIRRAELERGLGALRKLEPDERRALEAMTQAIVNKILHVPVATLKQLAQQEDGDAAGEVADLVHQLFALEPAAAGATVAPMRSFWRLLLLCLMALALPVQGFAAAGGAHCGAMHERMQASAAQDHHHPADAMDAAEAPHHDDAAQVGLGRRTVLDVDATPTASSSDEDGPRERKSNAAWRLDDRGVAEQRVAARLDAAHDRARILCAVGASASGAIARGLRSHRTTEPSCGPASGVAGGNGGGDGAVRTRWFRSRCGSQLR